MKIGLKLFLFLFLFISGVLVSCTSKNPFEKEATALINNKCARCHSTKRIYNKKDKGVTWWKEVLNRMETYGAELTERERQIILKYLAGR